MVIRPNNWVLAAISATTLGLSGCHRDSRLTPTYDPKTGKLRQLTYDSNSNGKSDTVSYMDGSEVLRVELDRNEDDLVDRWEYYAANRKLVKVGISRSNNGKEDAWVFEGPDGSIGHVDISTRQDGKVTRTEFFEKGVLIRSQEDTDSNGIVDKWETYRNGVLSSAAFDLEGVGRPTRRLTYRVDATVERVETGAAVESEPTKR